MTATGSGTTDKRSLQNTIHVPVTRYQVLRRMLCLYRQLKKQEAYLRNYLPGLLAGIVQEDDQLFSPPQFKRTTKYWQLALNLICDNLYHLTGKQLNADEQKRIILLSVSGPLFDDLFDDHLLDHEEITLLVTNPSAYIPKGTTDQLTKKIYLELLECTPRKQQFTEHLQKVAFWQQESLKQLNDHIAEDELYEITYNKSYYAVLLFCAVLDHYPNPEMVELLYPVAGLMQLTNDAFDVWKDLQNGVCTLPNLYRDYEKLQGHFMAEIALINHTLWQLPYAVKNKQTYAITIHSLHAMGWMALEQLKNVTANISTFAALKSMSQHTLVCDMDSMKQKMKWLGQIRRLANYS